MARMGLYPEAPPLPAVVGFEAAGRIDAVGEGVDGDLRGLPVIALTGSGAYTDVLCLPAAQVFPRPGGHVGRGRGGACPSSTSPPTSRCASWDR